MSLFDVHISVFSTPPGGGPAAHLAFTMDHQEQSNWCWAAVATSVARYYNGPFILQCYLVNSQLGFSDCCTTGASSHCNQPSFLEQALAGVGHMNGAPTAGPWDVESIRSEIDGSRPIGVRIGWMGGGGHFVIVSGYGDPKLVDIDDPAYGPGTYDLDVFAAAYQGTGTWTHTYLTK